VQSYTAAVTQGQEAERTRLARELHDDTAQALVSLIQRIKLTQRDLQRNPTRAVERLRELETLATTAWQEVRRFSEDLRPSYLEQLGLMPALTVLVEQGQPQGGPEVSLTISGPLPRLSPALELAVFRIVQEGLNNVRRHAQAAHVAVELTFTDDELSLSIQDDGRGFEPPRLPYDLTRQGHFGLAGMHERVSLVGGRLSVDSAPGRGTRIVVFVPSHGPS
jgi:signal transduction histidine kinase